MTNVDQSAAEVSAAAARTERAVAAAVEVAARHQLGEVQPVVLHDLFSVVIHLQPTPVVLRIPTVLSEPWRRDLGRQAARQRDELRVAGWLVDRGFPTIPPSSLLPREPLRSESFSMTAWEYVEHLDVRALATDPDAETIDLVARLHHELIALPEPELPFLSFWDETLALHVDLLSRRPDLLPTGDVDRARREVQALAGVLSSRGAFEHRFPTVSLQPIHGDAPTFNLARTVQGTLLTDFELTCLGPVEWDLALLAPAAHAAYAAAAQQLGLRPLNPEVMRVMEAARLLQIVTLLALAPQSPGLAEGLAQVLQMWREAAEYRESDDGR
jgi:hypothetical protein